jgi:hypothetical protein
MVMPEVTGWVISPLSLRRFRRFPLHRRRRSQHPR